MPQLFNETKKHLITENLEVADTFFKRLQGLIGRKAISNKEVLWIPRCNSIHTWFMQFAIDVAFVDKNLKVKTIRKNIKPWDFILPIFGVSSVFEFRGGTLTQEILDVGDSLNVGH